MTIDQEQLREALNRVFMIRDTIREAYYNTGTSDEETENNTLDELEKAAQTLLDILPLLEELVEARGKCTGPIPCYPLDDDKVQFINKATNITTQLAEKLRGEDDENT